jgi:hypothetical protein
MMALRISKPGLADRVAVERMGGEKLPYQDEFDRVDFYGYSDR